MAYTLILKFSFMAKTINEIGHNLELKQFVIHQVVKDAGDIINNT